MEHTIRIVGRIRERLYLAAEISDPFLDQSNVRFGECHCDSRNFTLLARNRIERLLGKINGILLKLPNRFRLYFLSWSHVPFCKTKRPLFVPSDDPEPFQQIDRFMSLFGSYRRQT